MLLLDELDRIQHAPGMAVGRIDRDQVYPGLDEEPRALFRIAPNPYRGTDP